MLSRVLLTAENSKKIWTIVDGGGNLGGTSGKVGDGGGRSGGVFAGDGGRDEGPDIQWSPEG